MSYEIVKGIKIQDNQVWINCASNNVRPRSFFYQPVPSLTKILKEQGQKALNIEILKAYESGDFQPGTQNKYSKAIKRLHRNEEFNKNYDWRSWDFDDEENRKRIENNRSSQSFDELLHNAFITKDKKIPCMVTSMDYNGKIYVRKAARARLYLTRYQNDAKIFDNPEEAKEVSNRYSNKDERKIEVI